MRNGLLLCVVFFGAAAYAQPMRPVAELIDTKDPGWPLVQDWIRKATVPVEVLPVVRADGERTLHALQVTSRSPMGALALESGGLLIDHGWVRFLGGGAERMKGTLASWNGLDGTKPPQLPYLVVAYDAIGGVFAVNGGGLEGKPGAVFYFAPDSLAWEDLGLGYSALLQAALAGKLTKFYEGTRWIGWEKEVGAASGDEGWSFYPPLWTREGRKQASRKKVPMKELWALEQEMKRQLDAKGVKNGERVKIEVAP
jgi:uncharacterized protein DUF2625